MQDTPTAVFQKMMATDYFSQWLGLQLVSISEGSCVLQMQVRAEMLNGFGMLHGGVTFAFADSCFAFASNSHNRLSVSLNAAMTYVKAATVGDTISATATERARTNKTATYDITVLNKANQEIIALFHGTVYRTSKTVL